MKSIEVKGHSGCQIEVRQEGRINYLYKFTKDPKYFKRLVLQGKKQQAAHLIESQHIRVPEVYEIEETDNMVTLKMQYVYSKNFVEFFEWAGFEQVENLIFTLCNFIDSEIKKSKIKKITNEIFMTKLINIKQKCQNNDLCKNDNSVIKILNQAEGVFSKLSSMELPIGICHGDLTFSNLLFSGNDYYLIDFLDSFIETPLQDIVKIRQDSCHNWSVLMYTKPYDCIRMSIIFEKIDKEIENFFKIKYSWYVNYYGYMQLMNLLRILPYVNEERVLSFLKTEIKKGLYEF